MKSGSRSRLPAFGPEEALDGVGSEEVSPLIADYRMPDMSGTGSSGTARMKLNPSPIPGKPVSRGTRRKPGCSSWPSGSSARGGVLTFGPDHGRALESLAGCVTLFAIVARA